MSTSAATASQTQFVELTDDQASLAIEALRAAEAESPDGPSPVGRLADLLQFGEEYNNPLDEFVRLTMRKRRLDAHKKKLNARLDQLEEWVLDEFSERGVQGEKHAATGKTVSTSQKVWARLDKAGEEATQEERDAAADALIAAGLEDFVARTFNVNSLSAYFRELVNDWLDEQGRLPEHERRPLAIETFLPAELKGHIALSNDPTLSVR